MTTHEPHSVTMRVMVKHEHPDCPAAEDVTLIAVREIGAELARDHLLTVLLDPIYVETVQMPLYSYAGNELVTADVYEILAQCPGSA